MVLTVCWAAHMYQNRIGVVPIDKVVETLKMKNPA